MKYPTAMLLGLLLSQQAMAAPIKVRVDFVEALSPKDTTSSDRFHKNYSATIDLGRSLLQGRLAKCGYELETKATYYEANDPLQGKEVATKADASGSWLIVGPRRSNHYLLLTQGAGSTPTTSLMASSDGVARLGLSHISLSPSNSELARIAAMKAKAIAGARADYVSIVSDDCTACVDFSRAFDRSAQKLGLRKKTEVKVQGESFDVEPLRAAISKERPNVVLIPNYSMVAVRVMNALADISPAPLFVGGDGWGDQKYGFVQSGIKSNIKRGLTVRGLPPADVAIQSFPLGKQAASSEIPFTAAHVAMLKVLGEVADRLCAARPASREAFAEIFRQSAVSRLHAPWGVSVYDLKDGQLNFRESVGVR